MKIRWAFFFFIGGFLFAAACMVPAVKRDLVLSREYQPTRYPRVAVIDLDPKIQFSEYVEAELLGKGYQVREGFTVRQTLKNEAPNDKPIDPDTVMGSGQAQG